MKDVAPVQEAGSDTDTIDTDVLSLQAKRPDRPTSVALGNMSAAGDVNRHIRRRRPYRANTTNPALLQVSLLLWRMRSSGGGGLATGFLARKAISSTIAVPGAAVLTALGPATVQAVREDGVAVVVAGVPGPAGGSAAPLPAFAGDRVR